ncbi:MAG: hypothetical protein ABIN80_24050 [Dyadobacter sp.]|uniref:hypothetical protein n=1 Tax=Dyadobacter sp. TaxID=1914288 RepID=UPI003263FD90
MKRSFIFLLTMLWGCSDPNPDIASKFVGKYICEQQSPSESVHTTWEIWQDKYKDKIKINITVKTDFTQAGKADQVESLSVDSVLVDSEFTLRFNNKYKGTETGRMIYGQATLVAKQTLDADITIVNEQGVRDSKILKFAKTR